MKDFMAIIIILAGALFSGSTAIRTQAEPRKLCSHTLAPTTILFIKKNLPPLKKFESPSREIPVLHDYISFYKLKFPDVEHVWGTFNSGNFTLSAQIFLPEKPKGTVFLVHGYLMHTGVMSHIIGYLLNQKYAVAIFDLPGHGLSSGNHASINNFSQYCQALADYISLVQHKLPQPFVALGHSTGCSILIEYLQQDVHTFDTIILAAPLVRSAKWYLAKIGYTIAKPFVNTVPRYFQNTTSNEAFNIFIKKHDPLQAKKVPLQWVKALYSWNKKIQHYPSSHVSIILIQGDTDSVVDWKYNIPFLKKKFPAHTVYMLHKARHELFNESLPIRKQVFTLIGQHLP